MQAMSAPMRKMSPQQTPSLSQPSFLSPYLPLEIITHVLTLPPVKTLFRFRCVSKSWLCLISNPNFIRTHLGKSSESKNFNHQTFVNTSCYYSYFIKSCSIDSVFYPQIVDDKYVEFDYSSKNHITRISILGSCNGLVCVAIERETTLIWNPSTRESKKLPILGENLQQSVSTMFGFGYDQLNDDYKLVLTKFVIGNGHLDKLMVYSLKTTLWRKINDFSQTIAYQGRGTFVNGVLHWTVIVACGFSSSKSIVSLDLGNEKWGQIAQPNYDNGDFNRTLAVLEGCLSVCYSTRISIHIWIMKKYGASDSWIKMYTIPHMIVPESYCRFPFVPLCIFGSGEILFKFWGGLVRYDPNYGIFGNPVVSYSSCSIEGLEPTTYVESLVSPNIYNDVQIP